jgi:hypothetical protein
MRGDLLATVDELTDRLGVSPLIPGTVEYRKAESVLREVSELALAEAGSGTTWDLATVPPGVAAIVIRSAVRVFTNPTGATQSTTGPYSVSWSAASVQAYLTKDEKKLIRRLAGHTGLSTIRTQRDRHVADDLLYVSTSPGSEPVLYYSEQDLLDLGLDPDCP